MYFTYLIRAMYYNTYEDTFIVYYSIYFKL